MIYLVRHGQTEFNRDKRLQGQLDSPLTELGVQQARAMGACLKTYIDQADDWSMIVSPLGRAVRTAEIIRETIGLPLEMNLEPRLAEVHVGAWEGFTRAEIEEASPGVMEEQGWLLRSPGGETLADVIARLTAWLDEIDQTDGRRHIVVAHGLAGRILRSLYAGASHDEAWSVPPPPQDAVFRLLDGEVHRIDDGTP